MVFEVYGINLCTVVLVNTSHDGQYDCLNWQYWIVVYVWI